MNLSRPATNVPTPIVASTDDLRVLLIGPDADSIAEGLGSGGQQLLIASDIRSALLAARLHRPDVVFLTGESPCEDAELIDHLNDPRLGKRPFLIRLSDGAGKREAGKIDLHIPRTVPLNWLQRLLIRFQSIVMPDACVFGREAGDVLLQPATVP